MIKHLNVFCQGRKMGTMALYKERFAAFEYDKEWLIDGFAISPFSLPLEQKVFIPKIDPFEGIFGVFADSLPDGWGRLLVDRLMLKNHVDPKTLGNLERLAIVGATGMGALSYEPDYHFENTAVCQDLDKMAQECAKILKKQPSDHLDDLFMMGGSSGGARPKIFTQVDGEEWIIKFPSRMDDPEMGKQEYDYSLCAKQCGIEMTATRLFPSKQCAGYFGTKRFDRAAASETDEGIQRIHMISVSGLLETSHRVPNLDYSILMRLTLELTKDFEEIEKLFRLMCFNIFAHNRDDHSRNFSFLYSKEEDRWRLAPAYDLTYSSSVGGEHATTVYGNGVNPGMGEILAIAGEIGIKKTRAKIIANDIRECVEAHLRKYLANTSGTPQNYIV
ncbi:type II toxin-antitoxin system HipA family toxin [Clostridium sp. MCC353]|uniref:type II toxin-antitoxin system HipA family toxin n=1 Tax=Clostridium sp. MCC353 TaxID=2592646 RepID=UPI001C01EADB|nr:type II toxin-antitoxin system HipA family toxin [Clostridium sp. MCC353]